MQRLIDDLVDSMRAAHGAGLAAPQIGEPVRIAVVEVGDNPRYPYKPRLPLTVLVNPTVAPIGDETFEVNEGCLSVPDLRGFVTRHLRVEVRYLDRCGTPRTELHEGLSAGTFQHELDHLDGTLFVDRVTDTRTLATWEEFDRHVRPAFLADIERLSERLGR